MKKQLLHAKFVIFGLGCMLLLSCNEKQNAASTAVVSTTAKLKDTISEAKFLEWTKRWAAKSKGYMDSSTINYFTMPNIDLREYLHEATSNARFYIGLDSIGAKNYLPHLLLTGSQKKGSQVTSYKEPIFDLTSVCPPVCDSIAP